AFRLLLWPDRADLGCTLRCRRTCGHAGRRSRPCPAHRYAAHGSDGMKPGWIMLALIAWLGLWAGNEWLVRREPKSKVMARLCRLAVPLLFGISLLLIWEGVTRGFAIPSVLLPPPSQIWERIVSS